MKKNAPKIVHMANLWSLVGYPPKKKEWDIERKIAAIKEAGFDAITTLLTPKLARLAKKYDLGVVGFPKEDPFSATTEIRISFCPSLSKSPMAESLRYPSNSRVFHF